MALGALGSFSEATLSIGSFLEVLGGFGNSAGLEGECARLAVISSIVVLKLDQLAAERVLFAVRLGIGSEPLRVVRETKVKLLCRGTDRQVLVNGVQGSLHTTVVGGNVVATVNQIIAHDIDIIDGLEDLRALLLGEGNEILLAARDGNGKSLLSNGLAESFQELGVSFDFIHLLGVRNVLVVLTVTTRVLPVDI